MFTKSLVAALALAATVVALGSAVHPASANLITNWDFSANASKYTTYPGYDSTSPNPSNPKGWLVAGAGVNGHSGVNGPDTGFSGEPFAPASTTGVADFAFLQHPGEFISQGVATAKGHAYTLAFDGAARNGNSSAVLEVIVTDDVSGKQIYKFTPSLTTSKFKAFTLNFTATSGLTNIKFLNNSKPGVGSTADVSDVSLASNRSRAKNHEKSKK